MQPFVINKQPLERRRFSHAGWVPALVLLASLPAATVHAAARECFQIFDATAYQAKPDLTPHGVRSAHVVYGIRQLWRDQRTPEQLAQLPPQANVEAAMAESLQASAPLIVLDVEHWPNVGSDEVVAETLGKYLQLAEWAQAAAGDTPVTYYGVPPLRDYWRAIKGVDAAAYQLWQAENDKFVALAARMNALTPSLYTFYNDIEGWKVYAAANIREARRLAPDKPVYPFIWPQYHNSNLELGGQYLPAEMWLQELRTLEQIADGVIIWSGGPGAWNPDAAWWQATLAFIESSDTVCRPPE